MNPFMSEQLARAQAADWARVAEQRRLAKLATRNDASSQPPTSWSPRVVARLTSWADNRIRTIRQALTS
jgi:hypothetical protein